MFRLHSESQLAYLVEQQVKLSLGLVVGLRGALRDTGRPDVVPVLDLIAANLDQTGIVCQKVIANRRQARQLAVDTAMGSIEALGGAPARHAASVLAENLQSGSHQAYPEPLAHSVQIPSKKG